MITLLLVVARDISVPVFPRVADANHTVIDLQMCGILKGEGCFLEELVELNNYQKQEKEKMFEG